MLDELPTKWWVRLRYVSSVTLASLYPCHLAHVGEVSPAPLSFIPGWASSVQVCLLLGEPTPSARSRPSSPRGRERKTKFSRFCVCCS